MGRNESRWSRVRSPLSASIDLELTTLLVATHQHASLSSRLPGYSRQKFDIDSTMIFTS